MNDLGDKSGDLLVRARCVLLDALEALDEHKNAVIVIGAQAVYLRTGGIRVALAEATKDSDVAIDPRVLADEPLLETAMKKAGFFPSINGQPGAWVSKEGIPVDLMVPENLAGRGSRSVNIPPHNSRATRRARGLEATLVDYSEMQVAALEPTDHRIVLAKVAGPAALLVAKLHKIAERIETPHRLNDKDAHDAYRILRAIDTDILKEAFIALLDNALSSDVTREAAGYLQSFFSEGPEAIGSMMAGRAEEGIGEPEQVAVAVSILAQDLLEAINTEV